MSKVSYRCTLFNVTWCSRSSSYSSMSVRVSVGCTVFGWSKSGMWMGSRNSVVKQLNQLTSVQKCTYGELAGSALDLEQLLSPLSSAGCHIFKTLTANSTPIKSGQTSSMSVSLAAKVKKWLLIWTEEYRFVSVAQNQSLAGELESLLLRCDLFTMSMKRVICPSVCSFRDKPHWLVRWQHLCWRISYTVWAVTAGCWMWSHFIYWQFPESFCMTVCSMGNRVLFAF